MKTFSKLFLVGLCSIGTAFAAVKLPPSYSATYTFKSAKAPGTINKSATIGADEYSISSVLKASKFVFSDTITRSVTGGFSDATVVAKTGAFSDERKKQNKKVTYTNGEVDQLSAILALRIALMNNLALPSIKVNKDGQVATQTFSVTSKTASVSTPMGDVTAVELTSSGSNGNSITYYLDPKQDYIMVRSVIMKDGETSIDATIKSYKPAS